MVQFSKQMAALEDFLSKLKADRKIKICNAAVDGNLLSRMNLSGTEDRPFTDEEIQAILSHYGRFVGKYLRKKGLWILSDESMQEKEHVEPIPKKEDEQEAELLKFYGGIQHSFHFYCSVCNSLAALVDFLSQHIRITKFFLGENCYSILLIEPPDNYEDALNHYKNNELEKITWSEYRPFFCKTCKKVYCLTHWNTYMEFDESVRGKCPQGHKALLSDL